MPFKNDLAALIDDTHRSKSVHEIAGAAPGAMGGLSHTEAVKLMQALDVKTIEQLASSKHVLWAQAICHLAKYETVVSPAGHALHPHLGAIVDTEWEGRPLRELAKAPPSILSGLTEAESRLLADALGVTTVEGLATNRFVLLAQVITHLAKIEPAEDPTRQVMAQAA